MTAAVLALLAPPVGAAGAAPARAAPTDRVADTCEKLKATVWNDPTPEGKERLKAAAKGIVGDITAGTGRAGGWDGLFGLGSTAVLDFANGKCPKDVLLPAVQSLPYLSGDLRDPPSRRDYDANFAPAPGGTDEQSAGEAAALFNAAGAQGASGETVGNLAAELCRQSVRLGTPEVALGAYLGRADLRAVGAVKTLVSLTLKNCPQLAVLDADDLVGRLNTFLISNDRLTDTPPFLVSPSWHCGATPKQIVLNWQPFAVHRIHRYDLHHSLDRNKWDPVGLAPGSELNNSISLFGVSPEPHVYALRATDVQGNESPWTYIRTYTQLCPAA
ncbi:hypothetical protein [Streptomyces sp. NPDC051183]|uniref:hypothetical protein n=1 Tax=unclassified Streptomyces TaxID=2593676 RepID=UPI00341BA252